MTQLRFCNDEVPLTFDNTYKSPNNIGGPANPKTFITPIIAAPAFDLDSWKTNGFVTHSAINESRNYDVERTGYNYGVLPTKCKNCSMLPCGCNRAAVAGKAGSHKVAAKDVTTFAEGGVRGAAFGAADFVGNYIVNLIIFPK